MFKRDVHWLSVCGLMLVALSCRPVAAEDKDAGDPKAGTVVGVVKEKGENWIRILEDGKSESVRYAPQWNGGLPKDGGGLDKEIVARIGKTPVGAHVKIEWKFEERPRVLKLESLETTTIADDEKPEAEPQGGTLTGVVKEKGENWIRILEDGKSESVRYAPQWNGGLPKDGGGLDKEIVARIGKTPVGARVKIEWKFAERPRVLKLETLETSDDPPAEDD